MKTQKPISKSTKIENELAAIFTAQTNIRYGDSSTGEANSSVTKKNGLSRKGKMFFISFLSTISYFCEKKRDGL